MSLFNLAKLIMFVIFLALASASQGDCPPWFFPDADNGTRYVCNSYDTKHVKCDSIKQFGV